jgi:hypothetical protein
MYSKTMPEGIMSAKINEYLKGDTFDYEHIIKVIYYLISGLYMQNIDRFSIWLPRERVHP